MTISYKQIKIVPGEGGGREATINHCNYNSYDVSLRGELSIIVPTSSGEGCMCEF